MTTKQNIQLPVFVTADEAIYNLPAATAFFHLATRTWFANACTIIDGDRYDGACLTEAEALRLAFDYDLLVPVEPGVDASNGVVVDMDA
jgi:hypothetical protein